MGHEFVRKDELVMLENDGAHCSIKCQHYWDDRCHLWNVNLIKDGIGLIRVPACYRARDLYERSPTS